MLAKKCSDLLRLKLHVIVKPCLGIWRRDAFKQRRSFFFLVHPMARIPPGRNNCPAAHGEYRTNDRLLLHRCGMRKAATPSCLGSRRSPLELKPIGGGKQYSLNSSLHEDDSSNRLAL